MNIFTFLREIAGEVDYDLRLVKGGLARSTVARALLEEERQDWLKHLEIENV